MMDLELPGKRKRGRPKRKFLDLVKENVGELVQRRRTFKTGWFGERSYAVATPV